jgi:calcium-dependent protein kinase
MKIIKKSKIKEASVYADLMKTELQVLETCLHPNITKVFEMFEDDENFYVVCELSTGGTLLEKLGKAEFSPEKAARVIKQLLLALNYMHEEKNIAHRDIKLENILCMPHSDDKDGCFTVKLTDFGFA